MKNEKVEKCNNLQEIYYINERDDYRHVKEGTINKKEWLKEFHAASAYGIYCPGDQRPFIRQYVKIPDRVIIKGNKLKSNIKDLLFREEWKIAIRKKEDKSLWEKGGESKEFTVLPNTIRYWAADPFIISVGEKEYLFFEMFDRLKSKGLIGYREINGDKIGKMKIAYEAEHHLSFPYIFEYKNEYYMMPEYSEGKELFVLKAIHFPDKWEKIESWMQGKRLVDSVLLNHERENYLLTQDLKSGYSSEKLSIFIRKGKEWVPHKQNPIVKSLANARLAGKTFFENNQLIRVAQDCQDGYGTKLHFNNIMKLSEDEYEEEMFRIAEGFGLGMGMMEVCGALSGMMMIIGLQNSVGNLDKGKATKGDTYKKVREYAAKFKEINGSVYCKELKGVETGKILAPCDKCILDAVELAEQFLKEN